MKFRSALMVPVLFAGIVFHTPTFAQNEYEQYVEEQLEEYCDFTLCDFFYEYVTGFSGSAAEGSTNSHSLTLDAGEEYLVFAVCDQACDDVDLYLYDPSGSLVASDSSVHGIEDLAVANAEIEFEAPLSGTYRLDVRIYGCTTSTCYYGVDVGVW